MPRPIEVLEIVRSVEPLLRDILMLLWFKGTARVEVRIRQSRYEAEGGRDRHHGSSINMGLRRGG